jgi:hypothetical protein
MQKGGIFEMPRVENTQIRQAPTSPKERKTDKPDRAGYAGAMTQKERNKDGVLKHLSEKKAKNLALFYFTLQRQIRDSRRACRPSKTRGDSA